MRPRSIVAFERCYLGSLAIDVLSTVAFWRTTVAALALRLAPAKAPPSLAPAIVAGGLAIVIGVTLLLWYLVTRARSSVAKWIVAILFAFSVASLLQGFASGTHPLTPRGAIGLVSLLLDAVAVWMLFRRDSRAWFHDHTPEETLP